MEDRERIAEQETRNIAQIFERYSLEIDDSAQHLMENTSYFHELAKRVHHAGYTRQPEPPADKVEAVAKLLYFKAGGDGWEKEPDSPKHYLDLGKEQFRKTAHEILKLFPEYESVELEALGDEGVNQAWNNAFEKPVDFDHNPSVDEIFTLRLKAVSQATIRKNQAKEQLYRVKEM